MIDYPAAPTVGTDPAAGGPRRRRPLRARDRLRRRAAVPERRAALLRRRARDRRAQHLVLPRHATATAAPTSARSVLTGFGEGNTQLRVNGLSWGLDNWIYAANGRSDGEVRKPGAIRPARPSRSAAATCGSALPAPIRHAAERSPGRGRSPASASSACRTTTGATASPRGTRSRSATSSSSSRRSTATRTWPRPLRSPRSSTRPTAAGSSRSARRRPGSTASRSPIFNASCGPMIYRGGPAAGRLPRQRLRLRAADEPGASPRARAGRGDVRRPTGRAGPRVPRLDRPGLPPGQPGDRPGRGPLRRRHVPRAGRASPVRARSRRGAPSTSAAGTTAGGSGGSGRRPRRVRHGPSPEPPARPTMRTLVALLGHRNALVARRRRSGCWSSDFTAIRAGLRSAATPDDRARSRQNPLARLHALWTLAGIGAVDAERSSRRLAGDPHPGAARARAPRGGGGPSRAASET